MKNLYKIQDELYVIDNNEKVTQNGIWARCSFTGDILKNRNGQYAYKVILTTNKLLIKDGVQAIDDEFLEWFVNNPSCEYVDIDKINLCTQTGLPCGMQCLSKETCNENISYKIIIPKEEPKQETLEEAAEKLTKDFPHYSVRDNMDDSDIKGWFLEALQKGAKWQQEQDKNKFSEDDISTAIAMYLENKSFSEIIKQLKNK